jgi:phosphoribosylanthranilate isomerase
MTRVKICGITNLADAEAASESGADAVGLNFYPQSRRRISIANAAEIRTQLPAHVQAVGVFVNAGLAEILEVSRAVRLDAVQLHGDEPSAVVEELSHVITVFKAFRIGTDFSLSRLEEYPAAQAFLFDAPDFAPDQFGGTGRRTDWQVAQQAALTHRIILAGGLNESNVAEAIHQVRPYTVDVASGIESAPGTKDHGRLRRFILTVRQADQEIDMPTEKLRTS